MSMNKLLIPGALVATILVAGAFAFIQIDKVSTVHFEIINALTGDLGITNQDISEELKDKLKLMNATGTNDLEMFDVFGPGLVAGFNIFVEAKKGEENVVFNLKEVYICGTAHSLVADFVWIEDLVFDETFKDVEDADIKIASLTGGSIGATLIGQGTSCVDVISRLAQSGRAGAMGLGSDNQLAIETNSPGGGGIDFVKCIAFTPNEADTLVCEIRPFFSGA